MDYGTVTALLRDGSGQALGGTLTFTPGPSVLVVSDEGLVIPAPQQTFTLDSDGRLNGIEGVQVIAASAATTRSNSTHTLSFELRDAQGMPVLMRSYPVTILAGVTVDLTALQPVDYDEGTPIISGPPGPQGEPGPVGPAGDVSSDQLEAAIGTHIATTEPHPAYDDAQDLALAFNTALI